LTASIEKIRADYQLVMERIRTIHIKTFPDQSEPVFLISNTYPGVWLEHVYDALAWAQLEPSMAHVARAQVRLFLDNQKEDGQLPCYVLDTSNPGFKNYRVKIGFGQIQECVSFTRLCLEAGLLTQDRALIEEAYHRCVKWDEWLVRNRMTMGKGLIELFGLFDTGHDHSARLEGIPGGCPGGAEHCNDHDALPIIAPDMNAVFYGSRMALSEMAALLGRTDEAALWRERAEDVRRRLKELCYCAEDDFYYDVDRHGNMRKFLSIHIANLFQEHFFTQEEADRIYERHMKNPREFWTPYPFPSMAICDPASRQDRPGNSWGFYTQGLTALRALRWMDHYGKSADLEYIMERWVHALSSSDDIRFSQELHPITGRPSTSSRWYSSVMLFYVWACRRLGYAE